MTAAISLDKLQLALEPELISEIEACGESKTFKSQEYLIEVGEQMTRMPIVLSGSIKVFTQDDQGEDLLLYYLESGDTCAMTLQCCLGNTKSKISAMTDTLATILFLPVEKMDEWMAKYRSWRNFVLNTHHERMTELLGAVDSLAFKNMEQRLEEYLKGRVLITKSSEIAITHAEIALDLHTSRVVVSRLMKKLEREGKIIQRRNLVEFTEYKSN